MIRWFHALLSRAGGDAEVTRIDLIYDDIVTNVRIATDHVRPWFGLKPLADDEEFRRAVSSCDLDW